MLQLIGIKKDYISGEQVVNALKGVNISFRDAEFVSILGQSGCGKTTLLNLIGGLDAYTDGDLIIDACRRATLKIGNGTITGIIRSVSSFRITI